jgi:hypothetical protein
MTGGSTTSVERECGDKNEEIGREGYDSRSADGCEKQGCEREGSPKGAKDVGIGVGTKEGADIEIEDGEEGKSNEQSRERSGLGSLETIGREDSTKEEKEEGRVEDAN